MADTVKIFVNVRTNKEGSDSENQIEIDREHWDGLTDDEKEDACRDAMFDMIEWHWREACPPPAQRKEPSK